MTKIRNRRRPERSLNERLDQLAREAREKARRLPVGKEREAQIRRALQVDHAIRLNQWFERRELEQSDV
jgi:hypothetical protein